MCAAISPVSAMAGQGRRAPIGVREHRQQLRIRQGVRNGELTRSEAARLEQQEARIRAQERRAKRDGRFTPAERVRVQRSLNRTSRQIYRQKHNNQTRR